MILLWLLGGIAGLLLIAVIVLFVLASKGDASHLEASVEIDRPPAEVYLWLTEPDKLTQWVSWLEEVQLTNDIAGVGATQVWVMDDPNMKKKMHISSKRTVHEPGTRLVLAVANDPYFDGTAQYLLEALPEGRTRLKHVGDYEYHQKIFWLLAPLIKPEAQKKLVKDLSTLKARCEASQS